jgi:hypothetical protein
MASPDEFSLPPEHKIEPGQNGETLYLTSVRRSLGIEDNDQGQAVIDKLRSHWDNADNISGRFLVMEVYFGDRVASDEAMKLGATFLWLTTGGEFDGFLRAAHSGYLALQEDRSHYPVRDIR